MEYDSGTTRIEVTQNAKGEHQVSVKCYPVVVVPGLGVIAPDLNAIGQALQQVVLAATKPEHVGDALSAALRKAHGEFLDRVTDHGDRLTRARQKAEAALPATVVALVIETAGRLEAQGFTVAGDPERKYAKQWAFLQDADMKARGEEKIA